MRFFTNILTRRSLDLSSFSIIELPRREPTCPCYILYNAKRDSTWIYSFSREAWSWFYPL